MLDPQQSQKPEEFSWVPAEKFFGAATPDYSSMAREAATRHGLDPNIFERQIAHESINYNPDVVAGRRKSPKGATGIAQFMPDTAARYGLGVSDLADPGKSLDAAARHMRDLLDETGGDYEGALAGYNAGIGRVRDKSWRNIPETRNYTRTILGAASSKSYNWLSPEKFFASLGAAPAETAAPQTGGTLPQDPTGTDRPRITGSTPRNAAEQVQAERIAGLLSDLRAANPRTLSPRPTAPTGEAPLAPSYPITIDASAFSESPQGQPTGVIIDRSGFQRTPAQEIAQRASLRPRTPAPLVNRDAGGQPLSMRRLGPRVAAAPLQQPVPDRDKALQTTFETAKARGDLLAANRAGVELEKRGWVFMPGESTLGPNGFEPGWPSIKPPGSDRPPVGQGTEQFADAEYAAEHPAPKQPKKIYDPRTGLAANVLGTLGEMGGELISGVGRAIDAPYEAGRSLGRQLFPQAVPPGGVQPEIGPAAATPGQVLRQPGEDLARYSRQAIETYGGSGFVPEVERAATKTVPLLLTGPTGGAVLSALEAYGSGADPKDAAIAGLSTFATMKLAGAGSELVDRAVAQRVQAGVAGALARYGARVGATAAAPEVVNVIATQHGPTVDSLASSLGFGLVFGAMGKTGEPYGPRWGERHAEVVRDWAVREGVDPNEAVRAVRKSWDIAEANMSDPKHDNRASPEALKDWLDEMSNAVRGPRQLTAGTPGVSGEASGPGAPPSQGNAPSSITHTPVAGGPTATVHAPLTKSGRIDPDVVRAEVEREIASRSGVAPVAPASDLQAPQNASIGAQGTPPDVAQGGRSLTGGHFPQIAESGIAGSSISNETPNQATVPESRDTLNAQLEALRRARSDRELAFGPELEENTSRKAVLVTPGEQMPASKGALESEGFAVTKAVDASGQPVGTFIHDPREVSRQDVKRKATDGTFHELLGIVETKSSATTEAVVARHPETGDELQAAMASPQNVGVQADALRSQFPDAAISVERPDEVIASREPDPLSENQNQRVGEPGASNYESISETVRRLEGDLGRKPTATEVVTERKRLQSEAAAPVDVAAHEAATSPTNDTPLPTKAQIGAGNYKHGHVQIGGLDVAIENPEGSRRRPEWPALKSHYGYVKRTEGSDGEPIDVFMKPGTPANYSGPVFVVDQQKANGAFDEHKAMLGWPDEASARTGYAENFTPGWKVGPIRGFASVDEFRDWLRTADTTKPAVKKPVVPSEKGATIAREVGNEPAGKESATRAVGEGSQATPAEVLPNTLSTTGRQRRTEPDGVQGAREREGDVHPAKRDDGAKRGERGGGEAVRLSDATGGRGPSRGLGESGGRAEPTERGDVDAGKGPAEGSQAQPASHAPGNYRIKDPGELTAGGAKTKFRQNVQAIQTLRQIEAEGRAATAEEQAILSRFSGWGQFPGAFNPYTREGQEWSKENAQLLELLSGDEYEAARKSTLNAHYTSPEIVGAMWEAAARLGFKDGRLLEPSMGIGHFFGLMPSKLRTKALLTGIELDDTTGKMAQLLYPKANVQVKGFEKLQVPDGFYDMAIGNVPFGDYRVHDPEYNKFRANIHDYFFLKSLDKVRPGGLVAFITSTGTMDKADPRIRRLIAGKADLVAAIRFPSMTFQKSAGTAVVTDLVILRKRGADEEAAGHSWLDTTEVPDPDKGSPIPVNEYFATHPEQILGRLDRRGTMYRGDSVNVTRTEDFEDLFKASIERLPKNVMKPRAENPAFEPQRLEAPTELKQYNYAVQDGKLFQKEGDHLVEREADRTTIARIAGMIEVRDALRHVFHAQLVDMSASEQAASRAVLNRTYDRFVKRHGALTDSANKRAIADDPDAPVLLALETYDPKKQKATKSDVFTRNTVRSYQRPTKAGTPGEAMSISLHDTGGVSLDRIGGLLGIAPEEAGKKLVDQGLAFNDPSDGYIAKDLYLSGNVRQKLIQAREAAKADPHFEPNVKALEKVQPEDIPHTDITVKLGAPWVAPDDVADFAAHLLQGGRDDFKVSFIRSQGQWIAEYSSRGGRLHGSQLANAVWGTPRANFMTVLQGALADKPIVIYDKTGETSVVNHEASAAANAKVKELRDAFDEWIWEGDERRDRLHRYYNDNFNNIRTIDYSAEHYKDANGDYQFPGMNPGIRLRPHQANAVWQIVSTGRGLLAHEVGTGKTFTMVTTAMELRRLGLAQKPAIAVPKAIIEDFVADAQRLYPSAKIISTEGRFDAARRRETVSRIATGDYDMVILTHDNIDMLPMKPDTVREFIKREIEELEQAKAIAHEEDKSKNNKVVKQLEKAKAKLEARLQDAIEGGKKDNAVFFEETGIDHIFVDEAHKYKSLPVYTSRTRIKGIPTSRSDRATNMLMRTRWLQEQQGGRGVVFATGTPIANTMVELYNIQRYLQYPELEQRGIASFDGWANTFGETSTKMEYSVSGTYQPVTRFAKYSNLPELLQISRQVMDVRRAGDMPESIQRPNKIEEVISVPMSDEQKGYLRNIQARAQWVKANPRLAMQKGYDNMLKISTDARKSAMDMRLVSSVVEGDVANKAKAVSGKVLEIHRDQPNVTQMIFSDIGINPTDWDFSIYKEIARKLVTGGIPRNRIIDFSTLTETQKRTAVEKLRTGEALVGIGSTDKMGTGVNAQTHLYALHHIDAPWLPASVEQRDGRGWRQGNINKDVKIYRYVTTGSFDTFMWQVLDAKSRFIKQAMEGRVDQRAFKEEDTEELTPAKVMAIASGNPHLLEKVQLDEDIADLERARRRHEQAQVRFKQSARYVEDSLLPSEEQRLAAHESDWAQVEATAGEKFSITIRGKRYTDRKQAATDLTVETAATAKMLAPGQPQKIGEIRGFDIYEGAMGSYLKRQDTYSFQVNEEEPTGTLRSLESVLRNIEGRVAQSRRGVERAKADLVTPKEQIGKPFKQAEDLAAKRAELGEVEAKLRAKPVEDAEAAAEPGTPEMSARELARRGLAETKASERRAAEAGFVTISEGRGGGQPPASGGKYNGFEDPEMEARWNAAKGLRPESLWSRVKEKATHLKNLATRDLEHLPRGAKHAELSHTLRQLAQGKGIASDEAVRILQGLTAKLKKESYDLFTRRVILDDLLEETERQFGAGGETEIRLPFGFTPKSVLQESRRLDEALKQQPDVEDAVRNRRAVIKEVTRDYLAAAKKAIGFEPELTRESYYRHQVLDYADALRRQVQGTGQKVGAPTGRGFLKKRKGSQLDINTSYIQAEHSVLSQMLYDSQVFKIIGLVDENYNMARAMKNEAKQANAEAIQRRIDAEDARGLNKRPLKTKRQSLSQFVRERGGIREDADLAGERSRLSRKESGRSGLTSATDRGLSPDYMREAAVEAGYFNENAPEAQNAGDFLYAVEQDASGQRKVYSAHDEPPEFSGPMFLTVGEQMKLFKQKIGRGFAELRGLAREGELWNGDNNEWETAVRKLQAIRNYDQDLSDGGSAFKYLAALAGTEDAVGNLQARIILKAISDRRGFVKSTLGDEFKTWKHFLPETHALWQPREGNVLYNTYSLPERMVNRAIGNAYESIEFDAKDLRRAMVMGGKRTEFAIPHEVAQTLDNFMKPGDTNPLDQVMRAMVRGWKVWQLISPHRYFKYNARNVSGDADAVFVGNPRAFQKAGKATHDLYDYLGRKSAPTPELQEWMERGGLYNLFQVAEDVGSSNGLKVFRNLELDERGNIQKINLWKQYWRAARMSTDFREAILRYAAFADYREQMMGNPAGKPKNYGASIPEEVNALRDLPDRAFKLSNDLLGAYNEVTVLGQWIREHLHPFWSWQEVNAKRYYRLFKNAVYESESTAEAGRKILGKAARVSPFVAFRIGKFLLKAAGLWAMLAAYNNLMWPDEEKDLDEKTRSRVHIIFGRRADGSVIYFDRLGMVGDFLSWFGLDEAPHFVADFLNNKRTAKEIALEMAKAPVNKLWQGLGPIKSVAEFAIGRNTYPNVFRSRAIRDRGQYLFQSFALGDEYAALTGKPSRGIGRLVRGLFVYEVDPGEAAYNQIMSLKSDFNQKRGKAADVAAGNDKSNAAYYTKLALRYGDIDAARASLAEYKALGGTPQGLQASIKALGPLSGLNDADKAEFMKTLTPDERARLAKAQAFYESVLDRSDEVGPADLLARPIAKEIREPVDKELHRLGVSFPYPQNAVTLGGLRQQMPQGQFEEFQQHLAESFYEQLGDMISRPVYRGYSEKDKKLALEDFNKAWSSNEHRTLHSQQVINAGVQGLERLDAEMEGVDAQLKEQDLRNKDLFLIDRSIQRTLHPRSKIQLGEQPR